MNPLTRVSRVEGRVLRNTELRTLVLGLIGDRTSNVEVATPVAYGLGHIGSSKLDVQRWTLDVKKGSGFRLEEMNSERRTLKCEMANDKRQVNFNEWNIKQRIWRFLNLVIEYYLRFDIWFLIIYQLACLNVADLVKQSGLEKNEPRRPWTFHEA